MPKQTIPGGYDEKTSDFELDYWENYQGVEKFDLHLPLYRQLFAMDDIDYQNLSILDIGSGAVSVFEALAPATANIVAYDVLAEDYNRIAPKKKFAIVDRISSGSRFDRIALFNMIDHVQRPDEVLEFAAQHLSPDGELWLCVHLFQPHGPQGHPQNFNIDSIVDLLSQFFIINNSGIAREGIPVPYLWYSVLTPKPNMKHTRSYWFLRWRSKLKFAINQCQRASAKGMKIIGLRRILPSVWRRF